MFKLFRRNTLADVIGDAELPSFPAVVARALALVRDADRPVSEAADAIANDPGLSVKLLGTVNSAAFALRHEVRSVHHAVALLGRNQVESILIASAVRQALPDAPAPGFRAPRFWSGSALRAALAGRLAEALDPATRSESFTAALLQDMAVPVLAHRRTADYGPLLERYHAEPCALHELERDAFGWDHAHVARMLCESWQFPALLTEAIACHHGTEDAAEELTHLPAVDLVAVLHESREAETVERLVELARSRHALEPDRVVAAVEAAREESAALAQAFA